MVWGSLFLWTIKTARENKDSRWPYGCLNTQKIYGLACYLRYRPKKTANPGEMKKSMRVLLLVAFLCSALSAQEIYDWEDTIRDVSEEIMMADQWTARAASLEKMPDLLSRVLGQEGSFNFSFDSTRISVVYAPDSSFRIMTGQAVLQGDEIKYYGLLQKQSDERNPVFFTDNSYVPQEIEQEILTPDTWNGAVYYNLVPFKYQEKDCYLLFGFAAKSLFEYSKVVEVLHFEEEGVRFGAAVFLDEEARSRNRITIVYSADVGARLNYDTTLQMIVFDNLIPMKSPYKERQVLMVPDGSYSGYIMSESGDWTFVDKLPTEILTEAPRERPVLDQQKGRDLFGRSKKQ